MFEKKMDLIEEQLVWEKAVEKLDFDFETSSNSIMKKITVTKEVIVE